MLLPSSPNQEGSEITTQSPEVFLNPPFVPERDLPPALIATLWTTWHALYSKLSEATRVDELRRSPETKTNLINFCQLYMDLSLIVPDECKTRTVDSGITHMIEDMLRREQLQRGKTDGRPPEIRACHDFAVAALFVKEQQALAGTKKDYGGLYGRFLERELSKWRQFGVRHSYDWSHYLECLTLTRRLYPAAPIYLDNELQLKLAAEYNEAQTAGEADAQLIIAAYTRLISSEAAKQFRLTAADWQSITNALRPPAHSTILTSVEQVGLAAAALIAIAPEAAINADGQIEIPARLAIPQEQTVSKPV